MMIYDDIIWLYFLCEGWLHIYIYIISLMIKYIVFIEKRKYIILRNMYDLGDGVIWWKCDLGDIW